MRQAFRILRFPQKRAKPLDTEEKIMKAHHGILIGVVGTLVALAVINRVSALAPVSSALKTITG